MPAVTSSVFIVKILLEDRQHDKQNLNTNFVLT